MTDTEIIKLSHQASTTPVSPTNEPVLPSTEPPLKTNNSSGLAKIPTNMLVDEITEIENDESPNRKTQRKETKSLHMGFQVEESKEARFFTTAEDDANGPFDHSRGFEIHEGSNTPLNIITKRDQVFGITSNMNAKETNYTSFRGGSNSFMSDGQDLGLSLMDREMMMTNYENNLEWGRSGLNLYHPVAYQKVSKTPKIHYMPPRVGPI